MRLVKDIDAIQWMISIWLLLWSSKIAFCTAESIPKFPAFAATPYHDLTTIGTHEVHRLVAWLYETTTTCASRHLNSRHPLFSPFLVSTELDTSEE